MRKKKGLKVLLIVLGCIVGVYLLLALINFGCNLGLRSYIRSFDPVDYTGIDRIVPEVEEEGYYTFRTDDDLHIMHLTDIHLGGGFWTYRKDKKTIYEVITMVQKEKPDLVILGGDNVFAVPGPAFNGGFTFNNRMAEKTVINIFEHEQVYFSTAFGNHDTESFDYYSRESIGKLFMDDRWQYCIFHQDFTDPDAATVPSVSNQCILLKNTAGQIVKLIMIIDTNAYEDTSIAASINWAYDTIHPAQVEWAADTVRTLSAKAGLPAGEYLKSIYFFHIPFGEYENAYRDLMSEETAADGSVTVFTSKADTGDTEYLEGIWDEDVICYGGIKSGLAPEDNDLFFETLADDMHSMEACFCGHDHINNAVVKYRGVILDYGYSLDNIAYNNIAECGIQRGATAITIHPDGALEQKHKNAYLDYGCDPNKFFNVDTKTVYNPAKLRSYQN